MKFISLSIFFFITLSFKSQGSEHSCKWNDSYFTKKFSPIFSKNVHKSKGWLFCKNSELTSIFLEEYKESQDEFIEKYVKKSFSNADPVTITKENTLSFGKRVIAQTSNSGITYDLLFFFVKGKKNNFVFSSIMLERPYKKDLELATKEVEKLLKKKPELLK